MALFVFDPVCHTHFVGLAAAATRPCLRQGRLTSTRMARGCYWSTTAPRLELRGSSSLGF